MRFESIRAELESRLADLEARLAKIKRDVSQPHSVDSAEQAQERENDEVLDAIGHETVQSIREVRAALQRIDDGTYAVCEACEATIPEARLEALPETTLCVDCAE